MGFRDWSAKKLFASWGVYWLLLLLAVAWRPVWRYWQLQRTDEHGSVSIAYDGGFLSLALWIAGPPLLLFLAWIALRRKSTSPTRVALKGRESE